MVRDMAVKYKYNCRDCIPRVRTMCIQEAQVSPGAKRIIERAFESHTDTEATWDLLHKNCLLENRDQMIIDEPTQQKHGLLSRMQQRERGGVESPPPEKPKPWGSGWQDRPSRIEAEQEPPVVSAPEPQGSGLLDRMQPSKTEQEPPVVSASEPWDGSLRDRIKPEPPAVLAPRRRGSGLLDRLQRLDAGQGMENPQPDGLPVVTPAPGARSSRPYARPRWPSETPSYSTGARQDQLIAQRRSEMLHTAIQYPPAERPPAPQLDLPGPKMLVASVSGRRILLPEDGELVLGRFDPFSTVKPDVDLTFEDQWDHGISRRHASVNGWQGRYEIVDLGSSNGTYVNSQRLPLERTPTLHVGDEVRLGSCLLYVDEAIKTPPPDGRYFFFSTFSGRFFALPDQAVILIGRSDPALGFKPDIDLSNEGDAASVVSRHHAKLIREGSRFLIEDLGSANKTQVDGQPVYVGTQVSIRPGQHLWLGGCVLAFDVIPKSPPTE
jgi:pSer/pThr/pTyr-binding forkhead associated (FHA) protein